MLQLYYLNLPLLFIISLCQCIKLPLLDALEDIRNQLVAEPFEILTQSFIAGLTKEEYDLKGEPLQEYDFIIIGAGSSGSVIASRLSEVSEWNVLLIEAGEGENLVTELPLLAAYFAGTEYNWGHIMEPQPGVCLGMDHQRCSWPRGKAVGGTSVINYMIYTRGNRFDYDRLAAAGNPGWSYEEVLPYFKKSERANLRIRDPEYHGYNGPLSVEDVPFRYPIVHKYLEAAAILGHKSFIDYNGKTQFGFGYVQATTIKGHRCSVAKAFLHEQKTRRNLHILTKTRATKIIINPITKRSEGVEYYRNGQFHTVRARMEVIVSAGTFHSPQLLMLSGIGPKDHLQEMEIDLIKDLPVGQTLYDHICFPGLTFTVNITHSSLILGNEVSPTNFLEWLDGHGSYTEIGGVESIGYIKTSESKETIQFPDVEFIFLAGNLASDYGTGVTKEMAINQTLYDAVFKDIENIDSWSVFPMLVHPKSKGHMKLKDKDPLKYPLLYGNYFTDPDNQDINTMVEAIKHIIQISQTLPLQRVGSKLNERPIPGCKHLKFGSDAYWLCALRHLTATLHHQVGTCKMGPKDDNEAIVDHQLRVYGIQNLRVADSSIWPIEITAHSNAPAIMIGEKASDMIKTYWRANSN